MGEHQLQFIRYGNSREIESTKSFGTAHNWTHNYEYLMFDNGVSESGQPQIRVFFPDASANLFTQDTTDPSVWLAESHIGKRLFQSGNIFTLQVSNGWRYDFEKLTNAQGGVFYQLQDFRDSQQNLYSFTYDSNGRFSRITEPGGRFLQVGYERVGGRTVISTVTTADSRSVNYGYTVFDDGVTSWVELTSATYGDGTQAVYTYSQLAPGISPLLEHAVDPRYPGPAVNMKYLYASGPPGFIRQELNGLTGEVMVTLTVSGDNYTLAYANGSNHLFNMPAGQEGSVNFQIDGLGRTTSFGYAAGGEGFLIAVKDPLGRITRYTKTIYDNPLTITKPDNSKESFTRDDLDLVLKHTDELGREMTFTRDASHRITRIDYPDTTFGTFSYNDFGQVMDHQRRNGGAEHNVYDARGLKQSFEDAEHNLTQYTYDSADRLRSVTDARGNTTEFEYNERGLLITKINPDRDQSFQSFEYDDFGNRTKFTDELQHPSTMLHDEFRRVVDSTDPLGRLTHYDYDLPAGDDGWGSRDDGWGSRLYI